jgi:hypothetical protein
MVEGVASVDAPNYSAGEGIVGVRDHCCELLVESRGDARGAGEGSVTKLDWLVGWGWDSLARE